MGWVGSQTRGGMGGEGDTAGLLVRGKSGGQWMGGEGGVVAHLIVVAWQKWQEVGALLVAVTRWKEWVENRRHDLAKVPSSRCWRRWG